MIYLVLEGRQQWEQRVGEVQKGKLLSFLWLQPTFLSVKWEQE